MKPKVRLKGFDEDWILATLKNIALVVKGEQINKTALSSIGRYYVLNGGIVPSGYTDSYNTEEDTISISEGGNSCGYVCYNSEKFWSGGHNYTLQNVSIDKKYLFAYLKGIENEIMKKRVGSGLPNIQKSALLNLTVAYPTNPKEQKAIGEFYSLLDGQIEFYTQQIYKLKQLKEASLISMFPQGDETTPRVRFKGFEGEWEKKTISKIGFTYSGLVGKSKNDFGIGDAQYITFMNVLCNATIDTSILQKVNVAKSESQNCVMKGDLLFNTSSETPEEVGLCAVMPETIQNVYLNSFCFGLRLKDEEVCPEYLAYLMRSPVGRNLMKTIAQGISRYNLPKSQFCQTKLLFPKYHSEQQQIASYFHNLDNHISLQEQRLEKLKQLKSACLDQMFV